MEGHRYRLPLAVVAVVIAAGAATLLLRPRSGLIEPSAVDQTAYFSAAQLERAEDFRGTQRLLSYGGLAASGATLALLAFRPPRRVRRALDRAARRPLLGGLAAGAGLSVVLVVVGLPFGAAAHERAVDVGLSTQDWGGWLADIGKSAAIGAVLTGGGVTLGLAVIRRARRHWWAPVAVGVVLLSAVFTYLAPVLIEPLFNRFTPLPEGRLRSEVLDLARRSGVEVGEVYRVDASRRTTGANAYVGGLGHTKRVVLYDNLIERYPEGEVRSVVAHELAHVKHRDVLYGLAWLAIVAPAAVLLVKRLAEAIEDRRGAGEVAGLPADIPALALALAVVSFLVTIPGYWLSREVEARADAFALRLTDDPAAFVELERRLALTNIAEPDPPAALHFLFGTHPTTVERIGYGKTFERERRSATGRRPDTRAGS